LEIKESLLLLCNRFLKAPPEASACKMATLTKITLRYLPVYPLGKSLVTDQIVECCFQQTVIPNAVKL